MSSRKNSPALLLVVVFAVSSCATTTTTGHHNHGVPDNAVIAHRGLPYWAPEETRPSYLLAREIGVHYLEADLQRTKDGILICLHDDNLMRTTNVAEVFPGREKDPVSTFTLAELHRLDAGSWFNKKFPTRARGSYVGLKILTLDELVDIAEGAGGTQRPGLCLETKVSTLFPGIEKDLHTVLSTRGWAGSDGGRKLLLQTFEKTSLPLLEKYFPDVPKILLLWKGKGYIETVDATTFEEWVDFGKNNGARFIGPSTPGKSSHYDLMQDWMVKLIHDKGLGIYAYTVNTPAGFEAYDSKTEGLFTDRADLLVEYYRVQALLEKLGL